MFELRRKRLVGVFAALLSASLFAPDTVPSQEAASIFEQHVPAVAKLEVVEPFSQAPRAVGTAFFVDGYGDGMLLTNYHVVSPVILDEDKRLRLVLHGGLTTEDVTILSVDAAHDIAVLRTSAPAPRRLSLQLGAPPPLGTRLFSIGHPADLATSVVEGTYNGRVGHSVSPRYHFTGSVNPGMSGGPALTAGGEVAGINVSTAGNQLSFVIPAVLADALLIEADHYRTGTADELGHRLARRLEIFQRNFFRAYLGGELPGIPLGRVEIPVGPEASFDCGAEPYRAEGQRYEQVIYRCTTFDQLQWPDGTTTPFISIENIYIESDELNRFQFFSLYSDLFNFVGLWQVPENEETADWECHRANVAAAERGVSRIAFCARAHEKLVGLYDAFIRTALLGGDFAAGVVGTFRMNGVTFDNAMRLAQQVVEGYAWNE